MGVANNSTCYRQFRVVQGCSCVFYTCSTQFHIPYLHAFYTCLIQCLKFFLCLVFKLLVDYCFDVNNMNEVSEFYRYRKWRT